MTTEQQPRLDDLAWVRSVEGQKYLAEWRKADAERRRARREAERAEGKGKS